ncbi:MULTISPECIES: TrbC/VirB2 family protein [Lysobacter]|uniref:VirB2 protein n=2 Tax=Lysobacter TaxID=68 RepID=A0A0S2DHX5_LYSEN|nr:MULTISPECIES: TrbC/VirB2 family protein [Lysobacter]ALN58165.1 VirB2 protein [Lysobacter enzymogenes]QCW26618.1 TrbC/VirB2 family protein [Lysobacter enzymogenes]QQQ03485.1 TrbC/VirB2 family protein [Lysobacter enzymogenes]UZW63067.1 TrbC/VirB2 family protein [Lysobacter enzymogenes]WMT01906.1 TrbC/VirB2 family protein [Lysobacter yananisis]
MNSNIYVKNFLSAFLMATAFVALLMLPEVSFAQTDAKARVSNFMNNLNSLLNIASVAIVTIAVIFAGYGIAFAHKRLSDVAPVLIGGFLIGAAAQLAKMVIPEDVGSDTTTSMVMAVLQNYA